MYVSLGVLAGLLLIGTLWDIILRKRRGTHQNSVLGEDKHFIIEFKNEIPTPLNSNENSMREFEHPSQCGFNCSLFFTFTFSFIRNGRYQLPSW